jgi:hypothetical protein
MFRRESQQVPELFRAFTQDAGALDDVIVREPGALTLGEPLDLRGLRVPVAGQVRQPGPV